MDDDARRALQRLGDSGTFCEAESLRRLLAYLGEATLDGRADQLKEYTVGVEALGRPTHYDPRTDSSARVLAARLRRKIDDYYRGEGAGELLRVGFPKGGFKLTFEPVGRPAPDARELAKWKGIAAACALLGLIAGAAAFLRPAPPAPPRPGWTPELEALWQPFLDGTPIVVSFGSPLFLSMSGVNVRSAEVNDLSEISRSPDVARLMTLLGAPKANFDYAGIGDVHGAFLVAKLLSVRKPQVSLKRGMVLSWEDIKNNHLVFIGNSKNQEKLRDVMTGRDFVLEDGVIRNARPRPGEAAAFPEVLDPRTRERRVDHGIVTLLPGLEPGRSMLLLTADSTETIWGVVEAVTNPGFAGPLVRHMTSGGALPKAFQALLRIRLNAGVPVEASYVTHHVISSPEVR